ncbi:MAG TPA: copper-binding protein [Acetobacteraceae bacterium]
MKSTLFPTLALAVLAACSCPAFAQQAGTPAAAAAKAAPTAVFADGEVRKVDKDNRKLTIRHGEIKNLDMPPMTMVFGVSKAALVDQVKAGDKIRFKAVDQGGGNLVVTEIEAAH